MTTPTFFASAEEFRVWLERNAREASELLVGFYKIGKGRPSMTWPESVSEALCHGWIDGVRRRIDEECYSIRFTPRKPSSIWSAVNIAKVQYLQSRGLMSHAGAVAFSHRKAEKSKVYAYEQDAAAELTSHEVQKFKLEKTAWAYFEACPPGYRKVLLHWVTTAKRAQTRDARLALLIKACAEGRRLR